MNTGSKTIQYKPAVAVQNKPAVTESGKCFSEKEEVRRYYDNLLAVVDSVIAEFSTMSFPNSSLETVRRSLVANLSASKATILKEKKNALEYTCWDKLVIGFFGETNAGKSTLVDALRSQLDETDNEKHSVWSTVKNVLSGRSRFLGQIIGDGRQDFTKDYHEYTLNINGSPIMLIDVPGIEGNEQIYADRIGEALHKAHVLFYVNGHNKPVDGATAQKIQRYLCHGVKVKLIQNIRGNADQYEFPEDRTNLMSNSIERMLTIEDQKFKGIFQDRYDGFLGVQGMVAFCANANIHSSRKDLIRVQNRLHSFFKEDCNNNLEEAKVAMRRFSNMDALLSILETKSREYKKEIVAANTLKLRGITDILLQEYKSIIVKEKDKFERYAKLLESFRKNVQSDVDACVRNYRSSLNNEGAKLQRELRGNVMDWVESSQFDRISDQVKEFNEKLSGSFSCLAKRAAASLSKNLDERKKSLSGIPGISLSSDFSKLNVGYNLTLDVSAISEADDISFGDVLTSAGGVATGAATGAALGSIIPGVGNVIGGIVGGLFGFIGGNVSAASNQTERAKRKANQLLDREKKRFEENSKNITSKFEREINRIISSQMQEIRSQTALIERYYAATAKAEQLLNKEINKYKA